MFRLLSGCCRDGDSCSIDKHLLLNHQYPICEAYLHLCCFIENCPYLHVKYTECLEPCVNFNSGKCSFGIMVC